MQVLFWLLGSASVWMYGKLLESVYRKKRLYEEKLDEQEYLKQQNRYFADYYRRLRKQEDDLRRLRHDMANNYVLELSYLEQGKLELLKAHYAVRMGQLKRTEDLIHTGNIGIDSLLNYKLGEAKQRQIVTKWSVQTGSRIRIPDGDLNTLLGNLMDNAMEAAEKLDAEKRELSFGLRSDGTGFCFWIRNSCLPVLVKEKGGKSVRTFHTDKKNEQEHGLGLGQVRRIVKRYQGQMEIRTEKGFFHVVVFLYMEPEKEPGTKL